jgi:hypothetical protein
MKKQDIDFHYYKKGKRKIIKNILSLMKKQDNVFHYYKTEGNMILGNQLVYEKLPTSMVDLDHCSVCSWPVVEEEPEMLDAVVEAGVIPLCNIVKDVVIDAPIYWGKTGPDEFGFCDVIVDVPEITGSILTALQIVGVIPL